MKALFCVTCWAMLSALLAVPREALGNDVEHGQVSDCASDRGFADLHVYVANQTGYPPLQSCVSIRMASTKELAAAVESAVAAFGEAPRAVYLVARREILVAHDFDFGTALDRSYLVHELVHAYQADGGALRDAPCRGWLEGEAYRVQAGYLRALGHRKDAFALELLGQLQSACAHFYRDPGD